MNTQPHETLPVSHPFVDSYLQFLLVTRGLSENTLTSYETDLRSFLVFLEDKKYKVEDVTDQSIFLYIMHLRRGGLNSRSLARHLSALRGFFRYCFDESYLNANPVQYLENPKLPKTLPDVLSVEEVLNPGAMLNNPNALREFRDSRENISNIESEVSEVIETHEKTKNLDPVLKSQIKLQAV